MIFIRGKKLAVLGVLAFLAACSNELESNKLAANSNTNRDDLIASVKICDRTITSANGSSMQSALAGFFARVVRGLEGPVNYCLSIQGSGTNVYSEFRVEYEDDFGIRYFQTTEANIFFGKLETVDITQTTPGTGGPLILEGSPTDELRLELIYIDDYGFVQIKGSALGDEPVNAAIKYYNFPSYEEALTASVLEAQQKCRSGELTVAQCLGFNFPPTFWWNEPLPVSPQTALLEQARGKLAGSSARTLGNINFYIQEVLDQ